MAIQPNALAFGTRVSIRAIPIKLVETHAQQYILDIANGYLISSAPGSNNTGHWAASVAAGVLPGARQKLILPLRSLPCETR